MTKVIGGCLSCQRLGIINPSPLSAEVNRNLLVLIETNKCEVDCE